MAFFQIEDVTITMDGNAAGVCGGLVFGIITPELARFRVWLTLRNTDAVLDVVGFVRPEVLVARTEVVGTNVGIIHAFEAAIGIAEGAEVGTGSANAVWSEVREVRTVLDLKGQALDLGEEGGTHHHGGHAWNLEKCHVL